MKELLSSPEFVRSGIILIFTALPILINCTNLGCEDPARVIRFPEPGTEGGMSVERAISSRRSEREYENGGLTLFELSQVLWAAQGITHPGGYRASPSAGALYPLEVYIAVGNVESLGAGIYKYKPHGHELLRMSEGDNRAALSGAALGQGCVKNAPAVVIIVAVYERTTRKYGQRGVN